MSVGCGVSMIWIDDYSGSLAILIEQAQAVEQLRLINEKAIRGVVGEHNAED
jgi:hypothetical protein